MLPAQFISKRSPLVPIRTLLALEIAFAVLYYLGTLPSPESKLHFFESFFFSRFFSYQVFKPLFLSAVQFAITIYVFLRWYYESYTLRPSELCRRRGVMLKRERTLTLDPATTVEISRKPLSCLFHHGNVTVRNGRGEMMTVPDVSRPDEFARRVAEAVTPVFIQSPLDVAKLLEYEEHERLEFKSSLRVDRKSGRVNRSLERAVLKTVAAFLNTSGGYLVLGVDDARRPVGLRADYETLQRKDADGFENHFTQLFNAMVGVDFRHLVKLWFHCIDGADICVVQVSAGHKPAYLLSDNTEEFFIRTGNVTTALKLSEIDAYRRNRWSR